MSIKDGGTAYPVSTWNNDTESFQIMGGLSLRDHFAGLEMLGWRDTSRSLKEDAEEAYRMADAMLRAREASQ